MKTGVVALKTIWYALAIFAITSCSNNSDISLAPSNKTDLLPPVVKPLLFTPAQNIKWAKGKLKTITPLVEKFDLDKIQSVAYDSSRFKPLTQTIEESKFNFNSLPEKDLDIDKLPSRPLQFKTYLLAKPQLIKSGLSNIVLPHKKENLFEFNETVGLKGTLTRGIIQDRDGLLWVLVNQTLYRYDGENTWQYFTLRKINNDIGRTLFQDDAGRLWIKESTHLLVFDPRTSILKRLITSEKNGKELVVHDLLFDNRQRAWVASRNGGVAIIDMNKNTVHLLDKTNCLSGLQTYGFLRDRDNRLWINTTNGMNVVDVNRHKITYMAKAIGPPADTTYACACDAQNRIWLTDEKQIIVIDTKNGSIKRFDCNAVGRRQDLTGFLGINNAMWVATQKGIKEINIDKRIIKNITTSAVELENVPYFMQHGSHGLAWLLYSESGVRLYEHNPAIKAHIGNEEINAVGKDSRNLVWEGTNNGINIIDIKNGSIKHITTKQGLVNDSIQFITGINYSMFVGSNRGIDIIDPQQKTITHFNLKNGLRNKTITAAIVDKNGRIWMAGPDSGIDIYNPQDKTLAHLGKAEGLIDDDAIDMVTDDKNNIWIATLAGIDVIEAETGKIKSIKDAVLSENIGLREMLPDKNGNVWIGSDAIGVYAANLKNKTLTAFDTPQGLITNQVYSLASYGGDIYAGTLGGVTVIKDSLSGADNGGVISFKKNYRLTKKGAGSFSDLFTDDGTYWWADNGMNALDFTRKKDIHWPVYVTGLNILDKPKYFIDTTGNEVNNVDTLSAENEDIFEKKKKAILLNDFTIQNKVIGPYNMPVDLRLSHNQNCLQFKYNAVSLFKQDTTWYSYILTGVDTKWSEATATGTTGNYFNLPPGTYTFKVAAKNTYSEWGTPSKFTFTILPPWWQTWWAYTGYILLLIGFIYIVNRLRSRQLRRENQQLEQGIQLRTKQLSEANYELEGQKAELSKSLVSLKSTQNQLIQAEKMASLGELTAGIAHEIQNPLNFVNNFSEVNREILEELKAESSKPKAARDEQLEIDLINDLIENESKINQHGKRADSIVKGMLEHSKTGSGAKELTNINTLADEFLRLSYQGFRAKDKSFNAEIITHFNADIPKVSIVAKDIGRVLLNLYNNAFYAVNEKQKTAASDYKPTIEVTTAPPLPPPGGGVKGIVIIVKDNGNGIPDAIKDKIMQPFFTTKPTGEGTGLGLSLSYDIVVKAHGGSIKVESSEGQGSEFIIELPIA